MRLFYHPACLEHDMGDHPESPERLTAIVAALAREGIPETSLLRPEAADPALLAQVHDAGYLAALERAAERGGGYWDLDTFISPGSYRAAVLAAGAAVAAAESALGGTPAFALARPPGHHALYSSAMGFCLINNVAVAAQHCINRGVERVLIVDWDVHHGNGTQDYAYERPDVFFFSTHQHPFYPGTGFLREIGQGAGKGFTANVPIPAGVGDEGYARVFDEVLSPLAVRYKPQVILISAGYDAHAADPIGGMTVTVAGFYALAEKLRRLSLDIEECAGRIAAILEGGYNTQALSASVLATIAALDGQQPPTEAAPGNAPHPPTRSPDLTNLIADVRRIHELG